MRLLKWLLLALLLASPAAFAQAVRQEAIGTLNNGANSTTAAATFGAAVLSGSTIECLVTWGDVAADAPTTRVDSASQSYTVVVAAIFDSGNATSSEMILKQSSTATSAITVTVTYPTAVGFGGVWCKELTGVGTLVAGIGHDQNPGVTSTDGITSTAITGTPTAPYFVSGYTADVNGQSPPPVAGTGFTAGGSGFNYMGNPLARSESKSVTTGSTPNAATFTDALGASAAYLTFGMIYPASGGGAPAVSRGMLLGVGP